jgi:hypothetical protein
MVAESGKLSKSGLGIGGKGSFGAAISKPLVAEIGRGSPLAPRPPLVRVRFAALSKRTRDRSNRSLGAGSGRIGAESNVAFAGSIAPSLACEDAACKRDFCLEKYRDFRCLTDTI